MTSIPRVSRRQIGTGRAGGPLRLAGARVWMFAALAASALALAGCADSSLPGMSFPGGPSPWLPAGAPGTMQGAPSPVTSAAPTAQSGAAPAAATRAMPRAGALAEAVGRPARRSCAASLRYAGDGPKALALLVGGQREYVRMRRPAICRPSLAR